METNQAVLDLESLPSVFPHGVARAAQLNALGLTRGDIRELCGENGPWQQLQPDVALLSDSPPTRAQRLQAALHLAGANGVVTGREAMWLHDLSTPSQGAIHLLVSSHGPRRSDGSVRIEPTIRPPNPLWRNGFPVAPLARATVDACRATASHTEVRVLVLDAIHVGAVPVESLRHELDRGRKQGTTLLRQVLADVDRGFRLAGGHIARELVARAGLPPPEWGIRLSTPDKVHLGIVDAWWDDVGMAWDFDAHRPWAARTAQSVSDRADRMTAHGVVAVHTTAQRAQKDAAAVVEDLRNAYRSASARPRPEVVAS
ncbi:hypothetical protein [Alloactinosynnema sp. L-07]|uniref:hypothetical protein n=1 Tax=Alloactinosynnema sp. L-07 TaxID=1653480 RepID=UPI00065F0802|nr:hypothetical protein [Alloactinosynnema sp. L-07]CRK55571.1 hypothetical protein [Alloactinosynnema sp. L-07]